MSDRHYVFVELRIILVDNVLYIDKTSGTLWCAYYYISWCYIEVWSCTSMIFFIYDCDEL